MTAATSVCRRRMAIALSIFYAVAGILHLTLPQPFVAITPAWVPNPETIIFLTGLCEVACAVGLWVPGLKRFAAAALALYAFCVFPANIKHALDSLGTSDPSLWPWAYHLVRLPLQPVIVWAALFGGGIVTWPFGSRDAEQARDIK
ncbi:DoxX family protein [Rhizobium wenxiniae]|uniref:DoxX family protein n=1 Tax=Rhizobium wenxiniae TaxID=1737357 RepID=UPI001C6EB17E|nr:DoxX family protein [Rhizobium wenxiniae]MBW9091847.1 DoxX family protein [Rhizobium wenxiniae]